MMHVGDILSTVGDVQYCGGYHDTCGEYHEYSGGCSVPWGTQITKDFSPTVVNTPQGTHDIPTILSIPYGTAHPHGTVYTLCRVQLFKHVQPVY